MPGGGEHRKWTRRLLGNSHPEVHKWIDLPHRWMGRNHRKLFHDPISAPAMGFFAALFHGNNPLTGAAAGLLHTVHDSIDSALGGSKTRRARKWLAPVGGLLLPVLLLLAIFALPTLIIIAVVQATSKSTDRPRVSTSSDSTGGPPPPTELQTYVLRRHKAGHSRRDIAMALIQRGHEWQDAQGALSIVPREEWAQTDSNEGPVAAPNPAETARRTEWTRL